MKGRYMSTFQNYVRRFYNEKGRVGASVPERWDYLKEERAELDEILERCYQVQGADVADRMSIAKELADEMACLYGIAERLRINLDIAFVLVMESNMTKSFTSAGKIQKGPDYVEPNMTAAVQ